jgi:hypothetical protein
MMTAHQVLVIIFESRQGNKKISNQRRADRPETVLIFRRTIK